MHTALVLTVLGPDRPGLIEALSAVIVARGGNWVQSRMARLAGQFAGVLRVDVPVEQAQALTNDLKQLDDKGLTIVVHRSESDAGGDTGRPLTLELFGHDRPGIIRDISHALAQRHINVTELHTECFSAPMSGDAMFKASARLHAPVNLSLEELRATLEQLESDLGVDITLEEAPKLS